MKIEKKDPLYLQVYEQLKQYILEGGWSPGERLVESQIASELHLSRSPVREALRILEHEGLIVKKDQNLYIHNPSVEDIIELYQIRFGLEAVSCYLAADVVTEEELMEMKEILEMTEQSLRNGDSQEIYEWNTRFHESIIYASKNKHLIQIMDSLRSKVLYCRNVLIRFDYVRMDNFFQEHMNIYLAIKEGRREQAKALMEDHISVDLDRILGLFPDGKFEGGLK
ncbi:FCD domain-containing protein [Ornithinibacillus sp. L9]|uniref:FCD domain-containing protein n=1 Tax=Ornithinibacillus caprae TaxID=2678566 RepID=A0A6N8FK10_9BACI|nr:GntR family transcriptional regulator [Ornithinibacillus caprae]MUK87638.1 FCD domain-containing protein [Ornithinibacillus caprae]